MLTAPFTELRGGASAPAGADGAAAHARVVVEGPDGARHLLVQACDMAWPANGDSDPRAAGAARLLVLSDVTSVTRSLQVRTDFVANASHELRTPLATIRAAVEMLTQPDVEKDVAALREYVSIIDRQSARLVALARDLLDLANLEDPGNRIEPRTLPLAELLEDLGSHFADALARRDLRFERTLASGAPQSVYASPLLLRLALDNLIDNAIKFSETGGSVELRVSSAETTVVFEVRDHGCGIPLEEQERVFERFYQVERARSGRERGTGLGLSIVRHAVTAMGGAVSLESAPEKGTCVRITLPRGAAKPLCEE
jgi:signal transduction histidine kinase